MTTTLPNNPFESTILGVDAFSALSGAAVQPASKVRVEEIPEVSASLWRESMKAAAGNRTRNRMERSFFSVIAALGLGSVGYAAWQTCMLMNGNALHDAVAAFTR